MPGIGQTQKKLQVQIYNLKENEVKVKPHVEMDVLVENKNKEHRAVSSE